MKFFKCLSQNVSILQEKKESAVKVNHKLDFKQKKRRSALAERETLPRKIRGLSVRFAVSSDENSQDNEPLVEGIKQSESEGKTVTGLNRGVQITTCRTDFDSPVPDSPIRVQNNLNKTYTVCHTSTRELKRPSPVGSSVPRNKFQKYLSKMAACNENSLLNSETDEPIVSFSNIYATNSQFVDSHVTPKNRLRPYGLRTDKPDFHDRFPQSCHVGTISEVLSSGTGREPFSSDKSLQTRDLKESGDYSLTRLSAIQEPISNKQTGNINRLIGHNWSNNRHSTAKEPIGVRDSSCTDYFHLNGQEPSSDSQNGDDKGADIGTDEGSSMEAGRLDSATVGPEGLFVVKIVRNKKGFGFSLAGERPPFISKVEKGSPADKSGIKKGDMLLKVGNRKFHRRTSDNVLHFIRTINPEFLTLELKRGRHTVVDPNSNPSDGLPDDSLYGSFVEEREDEAAGVSDEDETETAGVSDQDETETAEVSDQDETETAEVSANEEDERETEAAGASDDDEREAEALGASDDDEREAEAPGASDDDEDDGWTDMSTTYLQDMSTQATSISELQNEPCSEMINQTAASMEDDDLKHHNIHILLSLETDFINFMHYGIEKYSRPLRRCILSSKHHTTIFQNIEKLVTISEYHVQQMKDENASINAGADDSQASDHSLFVYLPALVYESKIHMLCQAYEAYAEGFQRSNALMKRMRKNKAFVKFMKEANDEVYGHSSLRDFINRPTLHIQDLHKVLSEVLAATPNDSPDFLNLEMIVIQLSRSARTMERCSANRAQYPTPSQNNLNSHTSRSDKSNMAPEVNIRPSRSAKSLNIVRAQDRIVFDQSLQELQPCLEKMYLIYQGNIYKCNKKGSWVKYELLLFSEMLLLASEESDGSLCVSDSPVHVEDLAGLDNSRAHPSEFVLHLQTAATENVSRGQPSTCSSERSKSTMILRAASAQDKFVWKSLLEQRVSAVTGSSLRYVVPTKLI